MRDDPGGYDLNSLSRFIEAVERNPPSDNPDMIVAAAALRDALCNGTDLHRKFKLDKKPPLRDRRMTIDKYGLYFIMRSLNGEITRPKAERGLGKLFKNKDPAKIYDPFKANAQNVLNLYRHVYVSVHGTDTGFKVKLDDPEKETSEAQAMAVCNNSSLRGALKVKHIQAILGCSYAEARQFSDNNPPQ